MSGRSTSLSIIRSSHLPPSEAIFFFRSLVGQRLSKHRRLIVRRLSHRLPYDGQFIQYHVSIHLPNELVRIEGSQTASLAHLLAAHHRARAVPQTKGKFKRFSKKKTSFSRRNLLPQTVKYTYHQAYDLRFDVQTVHQRPHQWFTFAPRSIRVVEFFNINLEKTEPSLKRGAHVFKSYFLPAGWSRDVWSLEICTPESVLYYCAMESVEKPHVILCGVCDFVVR